MEPTAPCHPMARIPDEEIKRVSRSVDLVALIRARGIELVKDESGKFVGRCPFHAEEAAALLMVKPGEGVWSCASCGAEGNCIEFVEKFDGVSFQHAFNLLSEGRAFGIAEYRKRATVARLSCPLNSAADDDELARQILRYYHQRIVAPEGRKARDYLQRRGLEGEEVILRFQLGFADRTLGLRLPEKNRQLGAVLRQRLTKLGFYRESGHEHFAGSLIIPIFKSGGAVGQVYGRKITRGLRSGTAEHLFLPGPLCGVFNPEAFAGRELILCASLIDALTFWCQGLRAVTSVFGEEGLTEEVFEGLKRHRISTIRIAYGASEAGDKAAARDASKLQAIGIECFRIRFPWGEDANSLVTKHGGEALREVNRQAEWLGYARGTSNQMPEGREPLSGVPEISGVSEPRDDADVANPGKEDRGFASAGNFRLRKDSGGRMSAPGGAVHFHREGEHWTLELAGRHYRVGGLERNAGVDSLKITLRVWCNGLFHLDTFDLCSDSQRRRYVERAAEECLLEPELIKRDLGKLLLAVEEVQEERLREAEAEPDGDGVPEMIPEERREAEQLLEAPDLIERIGADFETCGVVGEEINRIVAYLACTSRLLARPLAILIQSTSAAGKTTLMDAVLRFFPEEQRIKFSALTGQSLYYLGETNLKHKILAVAEEEGAQRASYALKLLQSEGELTIASTGKNPKTGQMETQTYRVEGPVMIFLTTTAIEVDEELQNRCLTLCVNETREQTLAIHQAQRKARTMEGILRREQSNALQRVHRNAQRLLHSYPVCNPYVEQLTFTAERTRTRRDHEKYLSLIDAVTLLHQRQRKRKTRQGVEMLVAGREDIAIANRLAPEVLGRSLDELPPQTRKLWGEIQILVLGKVPSRIWQRVGFTRREVREATGWSLTQVRVHLQRLVDLEYLTTRCGRNGLRFEYTCLIDPRLPGSVAHIGLLDVNRLKIRTYDEDLAGLEGHLAAPDEMAPPGSGGIPGAVGAPPGGLAVGTRIRTESENQS